jgi:trehalose 6-phosphate synthase
MTGKPRLVVVSDRVASGKKAAGGLAVALRDALAATGGRWFGGCGRPVEGEAKPPRIIQSDGIGYAGAAQQLDGAVIDLGLTRVD